MTDDEREMLMETPAAMELVAEAVAAEKAACAELIDEQSRLLTSMFGDRRHEPLCRDLAAAIRRRTP